MSRLLSDILPFAAGVAISPIPLVLLSLVLVSTRAKLNGSIFASGWLIGLAVASTVCFLITATVSSPAAPKGHGSKAVAALLIVLGLFFLFLALREWGKRPKSEAEVIAPAQPGTFDRLSPWRALAMGAAMAALNPKNLPLVIAAAGRVAVARAGTIESAATLLLFVLLGSAAVGIPVLVYLFLGAKVQPWLNAAKVWLVRHEAAIMAVIFTLLGAHMLGNGIDGLLS